MGNAMNTRILSAAVCCLCAAAWAREGDRPVLEPALRPEMSVPDVAVPFAQLYRKAGSPRIVLLWNRSLSDQSRQVTQERTVTRESGTSAHNRTEKSTRGSAGDMTIRDDDGKFNRSRVETKMNVGIGEPTRSIRLEERDSVMVERSFVSEMNRGGVSFVDRALAMRAPAASKHRGGGDQQLIETDAILGFADLLMEVIWVEDKAAPAGYAFDVRTKSLRTGQEVSSVYTRGQVIAREARDGKWVAGKDGYVFVRPATPEPTPADVGAAISRDVMMTLGRALESMPKPASPR